MSSCVDVDRNECDAGLCGPAAVNCNNLDGTYECICKDGYEAKNGTCIGACIFMQMICVNVTFSIGVTDHVRHSSTFDSAAHDIQICLTHYIIFSFSRTEECFKPSLRVFLFFLPCDAMVRGTFSAVYAFFVCPSVCLSVCLSVCHTSVFCHGGGTYDQQTTPCDSIGILVF